MTRIEAASLTEIFKRALDHILARVLVCAPDNVPSIAVAYSGGLDSSVLLHLACEYAAAQKVSLYAYHIHHGLSSNAEAWLAHCERECTRLKVMFDVRRVKVEKDDGNGLEAAARKVRYAALGELCRLHRVPFLLTAHHQDDQAETVLLQMLRGAGLAGMSGMGEVDVAPDLLSNAQTFIVRPLLGISRASLRAYANTNVIAHIEDESNADVHHPRNALRNEVWPLLARHFPAFRECLARSAQHAQSAQRLLDELARQDLAACCTDDGLHAGHLRELGDDRADNLLRHWLALSGLRMPSTAWLTEARTQLLGARADAQVCVMLGDMQLRRYRDRIVLTQLSSGDNWVAPLVFHWNGEAKMPFQAFGGVLYFEPADGGIDAAWLRRKNLRIEYHHGGGRLKPAQNRPTRSLKDHYQERGIPVWERQRLPLVYADDALLFAAGIGQDCRYAGHGQEQAIGLRWEPDAA